MTLTATVENGQQLKLSESLKPVHFFPASFGAILFAGLAFWLVMTSPYKTVLDCQPGASDQCVLERYLELGGVQTIHFDASRISRVYRQKMVTFGTDFVFFYNVVLQLTGSESHYYFSYDSGTEAEDAVQEILQFADNPSRHALYVSYKKKKTVITKTCVYALLLGLLSQLLILFKYASSRCTTVIDRTHAEVERTAEELFGFLLLSDKYRFSEIASFGFVRKKKRFYLQLVLKSGKKIRLQNKADIQDDALLSRITEFMGVPAS